LKTSSDGVPELIVMDERSKRSTAELCGDQAQGLRCTLTKGHAGPHECLAIRFGPTRWETNKAS
jgi:hypothetical protein